MKVCWRGEVLLVSNVFQKIKSRFYSVDVGTMVVNIEDVSITGIERRYPVLRKQIEKKAFNCWLEVAKEKGVGEIVFRKKNRYGYDTYKVIEVKEGFATSKKSLEAKNLIHSLYSKNKLDSINKIEFLTQRHRIYFHIYLRKFVYIRVDYKNGKFYFDWNGEREIYFENYEDCLEKLVEGLKKEMETYRMRLILS